MIKLIVGLGNPGQQYENTPHNVGFHAANEIASRWNGSWKEERRFEALTSDILIDGERLTLMKPLTFMNLSGRSVVAWMSKNGGEPGEVLVISDDIHLDMGRLRLRADGSHGGQKGLLSIINSLGTLGFPRLRVGIRPGGGAISDLTSYVLQKVKPAEREGFARGIEDAADCVETIMRQDFSAAMNKYNRK
jgi:PTH1 family peptidyl-tRNA hydrolase